VSIFFRPIPNAVNRSGAPMAATRRILALPNIDLSGKEVYETPDVEEPARVPAAEVFNSPDIEVPRYDRKAAVAHFLKKGGEVFEATGDGDPEDRPGSKAGRVQTTLNTLTQELNALLQKASAGHPQPLPASATSPHRPAHGPPVPSVDALMGLDRRLARLEHLLGATHTAPSAPLQEAVSKLEAHMALLDAAALEELQQKIRLVERDADRVMAKKSPDVPGVDQRRRIEEMYDALQRCDAVAPQVPVILNRLLSLKRLHDDADALRQSLGSAAAAEECIEGMLKESTDLLTQVEGGVQANMTALERNLSVLTARMAQLTTQVQPLLDAS